MIRSSVSDHRLIRIGGDNAVGSLTNLVVETPLTEGLWAVTGSVEFLAQLNSEEGEGIGPNPFFCWGFRNTTISTGLIVLYDAMFVLISVPVGTTKYLALKKAIFADGQFYIDQIGGPQ